MGIETDYLVVGAGALGMAFVDTLIEHSDADVVMVDRRHRPGGHWLDSYPFVQLHQPSRYYGVDSTALGQDRIEPDGDDAEFYERASGAEICRILRRDHASPVPGVGAGPLLPDVRLSGRPALPLPRDGSGDGRDRPSPRRRRDVHGVAGAGDRSAAVRRGRRGPLRPGRRARHPRACRPRVRDRRRRQDRVGRDLLVARSRHGPRRRSRGSVRATPGSSTERSSSPGSPAPSKGWSCNSRRWSGRSRWTRCTSASRPTG